MIRIECISINYRHVPVDILERVRIPPEAVVPMLPPGSEAYTLNTCNRAEIYWTGMEKQGVFNMVSGLIGVAPGYLDRISVHLRGEDSVRHLFRVASGLDSMVLGEPQILGQVKDAYKAALDEHMVSIIFNKLLHRAFRTAKRIRTETAIGKFPVSVASEAVELACHVFDEIQGSQVLVIGAGEMATIAAKRLKDRGVSRISILNRTFGRAKELAVELGGMALSFSELHEAVRTSDIIITSTGSQEPIITKDMMSEIMKERHYSPVVMIDIALPRDVEPDVSKVYNCYLYDLDSLKKVVSVNFTQRENEIEKAEEIIEYEVGVFSRWLKGLNAHGTIRDLYNLMEYYISEQLEEKAALVGEKEKAILEDALRSMAKRLFNRPVSFMKRYPKLDYIEHTRRIFRLDEDYQDRHKRQQAGTSAGRDSNKLDEKYRGKS